MKPSDDMRGSGRTTQQLQELPMGSLFIVGTPSQRDYTKALAHRLGRQDLFIKTIDECRFPHSAIAGMEFPAAAVDHAATWHLSEREYREFYQLTMEFVMSRVRRRA